MTLEDWRSALLRGLSGRVLELGVRDGPNFAYYPAGVQIVATDVSAKSMRGARRHTLRHRITLGVADAQRLPFTDMSFHFVVATLVFCSIPDPTLALNEIRRVLKPGGELRTIDHVRAPHPVLGGVMDAIGPVWSLCSGGCHLNRRTDDVLRENGYTIREQRRSMAGIMRYFVAVPDAKL